MGVIPEDDGEGIGAKGSQGGETRTSQGDESLLCAESFLGVILAWVYRGF